ncbi:MAG TPA: hypothetical protein PLO19_06030 [Candidatus Cryosericum sp.]|nr:hypothetical protein [Candidatus Cryosericum sp.]
MSDFSIELTMDRIQDSRTREYFGEVNKDYVTGSYRSATVMLWSVVVCDLLFKLEEMRDAYGDVTAKAILESVRMQREKDPSSPRWEEELLRRVQSSTNLLEPGESESLADLRQHRNLSAHPVLDTKEALYSPSREQVRSYMRTALEAVLTKPALLTRKVVDAFTDDVCDYAPKLPDDDSLHKYLQAKYFGHLAPPVVGQLFRDIWRITFHSANTGGEENRQSLLRALCQVYGAAPDTCELAIQQDASYFSQVEPADDQLSLLSTFLTKHPRVYSNLTDQARAPLQSFLDRNLDAFATAWYVHASVQEHIRAVVAKAAVADPRLSLDTFGEIYSIALDNDCANQMHDLGISYYGESGCYDRADVVFCKVIRPCLANYTVDEFRRLLDAIESNNQTYDRGWARRDHSEVLASMRKRFDEQVDVSKYPHFMDSINR